MNSNVLNYMAKWLPEGSSIMGVMASVNTDFNTAFQEEAEEIKNDRQYAALKEHISEDLEFGHGFISDPDHDEENFPMHTFIHGEEENVYVYLIRGAGSSVLFTSEAIGWENIAFASTDEWDAFSPWVGLEALVDLPTV